MQYSLRSVRSDDLGWLYELNEESYHDVVTRQFGRWDEEFQQGLFHDKWPPMPAAQIVICADVRVGVVLFAQRENYDWLQEIQIKAECRGQGLGTSIVQSYIDDARSRRQPLRLQVLYENHQAKQLYLRFGFVESESLENHWLMEVV